MTQRPSESEAGGGPGDERTVFLLDVDNTLLDNDAAKAELGRRIREHLGAGCAERFWAVYEEVRAESTVVSYPLTLARYWEETDPAATVATRAELADLVVEFPYADFLYPGALGTIAHLRRFGRTVVLSDGDPAYQPSKIARAGIDEAVDGFVLVYGHKEEHLREITAAFPADRYVLVEDKPDNLAKVRAALAAVLPGVPFTGVLVRQGKYAAAASAGDTPGVALSLPAFRDLRDLDLAGITGAR